MIVCKVVNQIICFLYSWKNNHR